MKLHRAFAAWLLGCSAALTVGSPAGATTVPEPGGLLTVAISDQPIYPAQYDGDVRTLPPVYAPARYVLLNDFEEPPDLKPPYTPPAGPAAPTPQLALAAMPAPVANFAGMSFTQKFGGSQLGGGWPPDTNGDVGVSYYIQSVNDGYAIYDKTTGALVAGFTENQLWSGAGTGTPCDTSGIGDPVVLYDTQADRWVLTHFAFGFDLSGNPVPPFYQCFAVSRSGDPVAGGWYLYAVQMDPGGAGKPPAGTLNDYGKFGIWTDCPPAPTPAQNLPRSIARLSIPARR